MEHCEEGADFVNEWVDHTSGWVLKSGECFFQNDRHTARRPWVKQKNYKIFDRALLESTSETIPAGMLYQRRLTEEMCALAGGASAGGLEVAPPAKKPRHS